MNDFQQQSLDDMRALVAETDGHIELFMDALVKLSDVEFALLYEHAEQLDLALEYLPHGAKRFLEASHLQISLRGLRTIMRIITPMRENPDAHQVWRVSQGIDDQPGGGA